MNRSPRHPGKSATILCFDTEVCSTIPVSEGVVSVSFLSSSLMKARSALLSSHSYMCCSPTSLNWACSSMVSMVSASGSSISPTIFVLPLFCSLVTERNFVLRIIQHVSVMTGGGVWWW